MSEAAAPESVLSPYKSLTGSLAQLLCSHEFSVHKELTHTLSFIFSLLFFVVCINTLRLTPHNMGDFGLAQAANSFSLEPISTPHRDTINIPQELAQIKTHQNQSDQLL